MGMLDAAAEAGSNEAVVALVAGFGGAVVGAGVAGGVTIWVAKWQAREQLRIGRLDKLDSLVFELQSVLFALGQSAWESGLLELDRREFVSLAGAVRGRAKRVSPHLSGMTEEGTLALSHVIDRVPVSGGLLAATAEWRADVQDSAFALHDLCLRWLADPVLFEQEKPLFGIARRERKRLRELDVSPGGTSE